MLTIAACIHFLSLTNNRDFLKLFISRMDPATSLKLFPKVKLSSRYIPHRLLRFYKNVLLMFYSSLLWAMWLIFAKKVP